MIYWKMTKSLFFLFLIFFSPTLATFQDGKLLPGEVYTENVYQTVSYKVSRFFFSFEITNQN